MKTLGRFFWFTGIVLTGFIWLLSFAGTSFAGPIIAGSAPSSNVITTYDFSSGLQIGSFVPDGLHHDGRGVEVVGNTVFYTAVSAISGYDIHLAPFNNGLGGHDFMIFSNPRPGSGIQDLDYNNGMLYALTGYGTGLPIVYALDPNNGQVISSVFIQSHPGIQADGFTILPNGDFLINDNDAVTTYRSYSPSTGNPTGLVITLAGSNATGVDYNPADNSLYFYVYNNGQLELLRTNLTGTPIGNPVPISVSFEDISIVPEPTSTASPTPTATPTATATATATPTLTPRPSPTPRSRPTPLPRPTPPR